MTLIAHITDLHILAAERDIVSASDRWRLSLASFGRRLDAKDRTMRLRRALCAARASRADHVLITGDLTETGTPSQFETLAEELLGSGLDPERVTLVPGNHDAYTRGDAFAQALEGPLRPYLRTSAPGAIVEAGDALIVPVCTAVYQPLVARSGGTVGDGALARLADLARSQRETRTVVAAQHHPPLPYPVPLVQWLHGLRGHRRYRDLLGRHANLHVLHGHTHRRQQYGCGPWRHSRIFSTTAVVSSDTPLRLYRANDGRVVPQDKLAPAPAPAWESIAQPALEAT